MLNKSALSLPTSSAEALTVRLSPELALIVYPAPLVEVVASVRVSDAYPFY
jgi:hypothetical protein